MGQQSQSVKGEMLRFYQQYLARAVGGSALRNQGAKGMVKTARSYLETIDLKKLAKCNERQYLVELDRMTKSLAAKFPGGGAGNWGAARKSINIFLFACSRELMFSRAYGLHRLQPFMELPLDKYAIQHLRRVAQSAKEKELVNEWQAIRRLTKPLSNRIQKFAAKVAKQAGCHRCELDLVAWTTRSEN